MSGPDAQTEQEVVDASSETSEAAQFEAARYIQKAIKEQRDNHTTDKPAHLFVDPIDEPDEFWSTMPVSD